MTLQTEFGKEAAVSFGGITIPAYDYPISIVGPSDRIVRQGQIAHEAGLNLWIKTEHAIALEMIDTPYIPVLFQWADRFQKVREFPNATGLFANWMHYGFTPSITADLFYWNIWDKTIPAEELLSQLARRDFGAGTEKSALSAWRAFSTAIREYPFSGGVAMGPIQKGPAHPLLLDPAYHLAHGAGRQFKNDLSWTRPWGPQLTIDQFSKMEKLWAPGVASLEDVVRQAAPEQRLNAQRELGIAKALLSAVRSTVNVGRFLLLREELVRTQDSARAGELLDQMTKIAQAELQNAREVLPSLCADSRLGYANSGKNDQAGVPRAGIYSPGSVQKKITQVERLLREDIPEYRRKHGLN
jgi:hypothetical protein